MTSSESHPKSLLPPGTIGDDTFFPDFPVEQPKPQSISEEEDPDTLHTLPLFVPRGLAGEIRKLKETTLEEYKKRPLEHKGALFPSLIIALTTTRNDIADLLRTMDKRLFKEAMRRLEILAEENFNPELSIKIAEILAKTSTDLVSTLPPAPTKEEDQFHPPILGLDTKLQRTEVILPVRMGGPKGKESIKAPNPWRDDLLIPDTGAKSPDPRFDAKYQLKYIGPKETRPFPRKVTNRMGCKAEVMHLYDDEKKPAMPRVRLDTWVDMFGASLESTAYGVRTGRIGPETDIIIGEIHPELFSVYKAIRMDVGKLISYLEKMKQQCSPDFFNEMKAGFNRAKDLGENNEECEIYQAARFLFLQATCIMSNARQNPTTGHVNVDPRARISPGSKIYDEENLRAMSVVLQNALLINGNFDQFLKFIGDKLSPQQNRKQNRTLIFCDSPYIGQETTTEYGVPPFTFKDHQTLAHMFKWLGDKGVMMMVANSNNIISRRLYGDAKEILPLKVRDKMAQGRRGGKRFRKEICAVNFKLPRAQRGKSKQEPQQSPEFALSNR
jgi:site-specific DNA-adenine methylase